MMNDFTTEEKIEEEKYKEDVLSIRKKSLKVLIAGCIICLIVLCIGITSQLLIDKVNDNNYSKAIKIYNKKNSEKESEINKINYDFSTINYLIEIKEKQRDELSKSNNKAELTKVEEELNNLKTKQSKIDKKLNNIENKKVKIDYKPIPESIYYDIYIFSGILLIITIVYFALILCIYKKRDEEFFKYQQELPKYKEAAMKISPDIDFINSKMKKKKSKSK